jgi:predicted nucleic acid-binding protein
VTARSVVADASPLIALNQIGQLALLERLFSTVLIPSAVAREIAPSVPLPPWIIEAPLVGTLEPRVGASALGAGEREAISQALEVGAALLIVDDLAARRLATDLGVPILGTLGVLLTCKRRGLLSEVRPLLDALVTNGFHVDSSLYEYVLRSAGEAA